jgi:hypothetical protein
VHLCLVIPVQAGTLIHFFLKIILILFDQQKVSKELTPWGSFTRIKLSTKSREKTMTSIPHNFLIAGSGKSFLDSAFCG